jgi:hypothetical protein
MRIAAIIIALLVGMALTAAVAWNAMGTRSLAAEARYQSCVQTAQAWPDPDAYDTRLRAEYGGAGKSRYAEEIWKRVQSCSR